MEMKPKYVKPSIISNNEVIPKDENGLWKAVTGARHMVQRAAKKSFGATDKAKFTAIRSTVTA